VPILMKKTPPIKAGLVEQINSKERVYMNDHMLALL